MCFHFQCFSKPMEDDDNNNNNNNCTDFDDDAVDEAEEALSLSDLPLHVEDKEIFQIKPHDDHHAADQDPFFEFLSDLTSLSSASDTFMCPADDIIFCGKLIPLTPQPPPKDDNEEIKIHRRSESLSNLETYPIITRSHSAETKNNYHQFLRISRSLDYQKLRRFSSSKTPPSPPDFDIQRSASVRSVGKAENNNNNNKRASSWKPKWYLPMFGIVKFPPEMDLRDIKSRQFRRSSSVMFPSLDSDGNFPAKNSSYSSSSSSSSSWRFIKALSCSDHASVAVTTSLSLSHA